MKAIHFKWISMLFVLCMLSITSCFTEDIEPEESFEFRITTNDYTDHNNCDDKIKELYHYYRPLAKKYCKSYSYCISCYHNGQKVSLTGVIKPISCPIQSANEVDYNEDRSAVESACNGEKIIAKIRSVDCYSPGKALSLYHPDFPFENFFDADRFRIKWQKNGETVGSGSTLACIKNGIYRAYVFDSKSSGIVAIAFYTATDIDENQKNTKD